MGCGGASTAACDERGEHPVGPGAEDLEVLGPFVPLAAKLGRLAMELAGGETRRIGIEVYGELAEPRYEAPDRRRPERRLPRPQPTIRQLRECADRRRRSRDRGRGRERRALAYYTNSGRVGGRRPRCGDDDRREGRHFLVHALGFALEMELSPRMALLLYDDVPGVIGRVGTLFGEAGVNIANMSVSRNRAGERR